jgi:hypothetical protein
VFIVIIRKRSVVKNKLKKSNGYGFRAKEVGKSAFTSYLGSHLNKASPGSAPRTGALPLIVVKTLRR